MFQNISWTPLKHILFFLSVFALSKLASGFVETSFPDALLGPNKFNPKNNGLDSSRKLHDTTSLYASKGFGTINTVQPKKRKAPVQFDDKCPCCSGQNYKECCKPYHDGTMKALSPEILLRARYSAYACDNPDYIINTTHKDNRDWNENRSKWRAEILQTSKDYKFVNLDIRGSEEADGLHFLLFRSTLIDYSKQTVSSHGAGKKLVMSEKGLFKQEGGEWFYVDGAAHSESWAPDMS
mmetsp:Transcript_37434/g.49319  ORF Transcript_37434/g.49319 Transcript_37434/m.49319 type:complete len:238 (+) Transcript_37434:89-802(+)